MALQEKILARHKILQAVHEAAEVAVSSLGLKIWGIDLSGGATKPVVRIFVDAPWEGKEIPFVPPLTREQKSRAKTVHPKMLEKKKAEQGEENKSLEQESQGFDSVENGAEFGVDIGIDECARISRMIGLAMEVEDTFEEAWVLEVSTPGLERHFYHLDQLKSYIGHPMDVHLEVSPEEFENRKKFKGNLLSVGEEEFTLALESPVVQESTFSWDNVKKVQLIHIFPDTMSVKSR